MTQAGPLAGRRPSHLAALRWHYLMPSRRGTVLNASSVRNGHPAISVVHRMGFVGGPGGWVTVALCIIDAVSYRFLAGVTLIG